jgi:hypothetical protein
VGKKLGMLGRQLEPNPAYSVQFFINFFYFSHCWLPLLKLFTFSVLEPIGL